VTAGSRAADAAGGPHPTALLAVDVQGTFADDFPGAGLPVPGAGATVERIRDFTVRAGRAPAVVKVVTSQDWHPEHLPGHIAEPGEVPTPAARLFPRHGVAGTPEAELHPRFATPELLSVVTDQVRKGQAAAAFSAFEGTDPSGRTLGALLRSARVARLVVYGWELANCVAATALDGVASGFEVVVVTDLCSVLDPRHERETVAGLAARGVRVVRSEEEALALVWDDGASGASNGGAPAE
jgi:nicotinamidase/pyrazinamidase